MPATEARFLAFCRTINAANFILKLPALTASEAPGRGAKSSWNRCAAASPR